MKIKQFIDKVKTTKDTVRHYESLGLIEPQWQHNRRIYGENEIKDFHAIKEMQSLDMSLKEIQVMFEIKRIGGCASVELLNEVIKTLKEKQQLLIVEEQALQHKKKQMTEILSILSQVNPTT